MRNCFFVMALTGLFGCGQPTAPRPLDKQAPKQATQESAMKSMQNQMDSQMMPMKK